MAPSTQQTITYELYLKCCQCCYYLVPSNTPCYSHPANSSPTLQTPACNVQSASSAALRRPGSSPCPIPVASPRLASFLSTVAPGAAPRAQILCNRPGATTRPEPSSTRLDLPCLTGTLLCFALAWPAILCLPPPGCMAAARNPRCRCDRAAPARPVDARTSMVLVLAR